MAAPLKERSDQQSMTHYAPQPDLAAPFLDAARKFPSQGLTGSFPALRQAMPGWVNTIGDLVQSPAVRDVFSAANSGGVLKGYARGGIVEKPMAGQLGRGIMHYQGGTDDTGVVPKQPLPPAMVGPPSLFQQVLQALRPTPQAAPQITPDQLQQLNQLMPQPQPSEPRVPVTPPSAALPPGMVPLVLGNAAQRGRGVPGVIGPDAAPPPAPPSPLRFPDPSTGYGQLLHGDAAGAAQNPNASPVTAALAGFVTQQNNMRRASALATPPGPLEWAYHLFAGSQGDITLADRAVAAKAFSNPLVQQYMTINPDKLAAAESDPARYSKIVQLPGFIDHMNESVNNHARAVNGIPQPDGTVKASSDPAGLARLASTTGASVDQAHPFHESHNYNDDELVRAISSIPKGVVNRILEAQFGRAPSVQEQITQATYAALQADYMGKQKAFSAAQALKKPAGDLQKARDDAYKALHDFTLEVSRGASLMPPG